MENWDETKIITSFIQKYDTYVENLVKFTYSFASLVSQKKIGKLICHLGFPLGGWFVLGHLQVKVGALFNTDDEQTKRGRGKKFSNQNNVKLIWTDNIIWSKFITTTVSLWSFWFFIYTGQENQHIFLSCTSLHSPQSGHRVQSPIGTTYLFSFWQRISKQVNQKLTNWKWGEKNPCFAK